jgi:hypothetical protein
MCHWEAIMQTSQTQMGSKKEQSKWTKRDRKRNKRRHGMRTDKRPTDIGNALEKRAGKGKGK